jgi:hypothetical protein
VNPNPQISQQQRDRHEQQSQVRIACAGVNPRLPPLPIARLDAESFAVALPEQEKGSGKAPG